jgi:hypothetical protein
MGFNSALNIVARIMGGNYGMRNKDAASRATAANAS